MSMHSAAAQIINATLVDNFAYCAGLHRLSFHSPLFSQPQAGQFFMIKSEMSSVLLPRPLGAAVWDGASHTVSFFVEVRGAGTAGLCALALGAKAVITGPLGRPFAAFLSSSMQKIALVSGGTGLGPLALLSAELREKVEVDFYAGFKKGWSCETGKTPLGLLHAPRIFFTSEDGVIPQAPSVLEAGVKGLITELFHSEGYDAVVSCGPLPMMRVIAALCEAAAVPCFVGMEQRMACGVGACLGCAIPAVNGIRHCCADGPVFDTRELVWN